MNSQTSLAVGLWARDILHASDDLGSSKVTLRAQRPMVVRMTMAKRRASRRTGLEEGRNAEEQS